MSCEYFNVLAEKIDLDSERIRPPSFDESSAFHRRTAEAVNKHFSEKPSCQSTFWSGFQVNCDQTLDLLLPIVDDLTQPRSVQDFWVLQRELIDFTYQYQGYTSDTLLISDQESQQKSWLRFWSNYLKEKLGLISVAESEKTSALISFLVPAGLEFGTKIDLEKLKDSVLSPGKGFNTTEQERRIITLAEAAVIFRQNRGFNGYIVGKFRKGPHSEHDDLFWKAKKALGPEGILTVGVESKKSIAKRRGRQHAEATLSDKERCQQISHVRGVDYVLLHDPQSSELEDLESYYTQVQKELGPTHWFIGSADYHWREAFTKTSKEIGALLLWVKATNELSTSSLY